jgi:hypothetical protein
VAAKEIAVKSYVGKRRAEEREQLDTLVHGGKQNARKLTRIRILLRADAAAEAKLITLASRASDFSDRYASKYYL